MNFTYEWRKKLRLQGFDYSQNGYYFVTICTKERERFFWEIKNGKMHLSEMWKIVDEEIQHNVRENIQIDEYVIMPNHIHIIIIIQNVGCDCIAPKLEFNITPENRMISEENGTMLSFPTLSRMIRGFKWKITSRIQKECENGFEFAWQKSFYDVIIRTEEQLLKTREYIVNNPATWGEDVNNSANI